MKSDVSRGKNCASTGAEGGAIQAAKIKGEPVITLVSVGIPVKGSNPIIGVIEIVEAEEPVGAKP